MMEDRGKRHSSRQASSSINHPATKFLVTDECGRVARWLRLMGYDAASMAARPLSALYCRAHNESRMIVTRNGGVKAGCLVHVVQLQSHTLTEQLRQLARDPRLQVDTHQALSRCDRCNALVQVIDKVQVKAKVPPYVFQTQETFHICPSCQRIYWSATHCARMKTVFERVCE